MIDATQKELKDELRIFGNAGVHSDATQKELKAQSLAGSGRRGSGLDATQKELKVSAPSHAARL